MVRFEFFTSIVLEQPCAKAERPGLLAYKVLGTTRAFFFKPPSGLSLNKIYLVPMGGPCKARMLVQGLKGPRVSSQYEPENSKSVPALQSILQIVRRISKYCPSLKVRCHQDLLK